MRKAHACNEVGWCSRVATPVLKTVQLSHHQWQCETKGLQAAEKELKGTLSENDMGNGVQL